MDVVILVYEIVISNSIRSILKALTPINNSNNSHKKGIKVLKTIKKNTRPIISIWIAVYTSYRSFQSINVNVFI